MSARETKWKPRFSVFTANLQLQALPENVHLQLRQAIKQLQQMELISSAADVATVASILQNLYATGCLPGYTTAEQLLGLDEMRYDWTVVASDEFADLLKALLCLFNAHWPQVDELLVINLFKIDYNELFAYETLMALQHALQKSVNNSVTIAQVLEQVIIDEQFLCNACLHFSLEHARLLQEYASTLHAIPEPRVEKFEALIDNFTQLIINIPSHVANKLGKNLPLIFTNNQYAQLLLQHLLRTFYALEHLPPMKYSLTIFHKIMQRLITNFGTIEQLSVFCCIVQQLALKSKILENILPQLFVALNDKALPKLVLALAASDADLHFMLKDALIRSADWKFCFMHKLTIQHAPNNNATLAKIVQYIWQVQPAMLQELFITLLSIWSKRSTLRQLSTQEHFILCKLLLFCARLLFQRLQLVENSLGLIKRELHEGLKYHLESPDNLQRYVGMQVVEIIMNVCQQATSQEPVEEENLLRFDYKHVKTMQKEHVLEELRQIAAGAFDHKKKPKLLNEAEFLQILQAFMENKFINDLKIVKPPEINITPNKPNMELSVAQPQVKMDLDLESDSDDDDLMACDMSNDTSLISEKRPKFLLDLIQTLSSKCENYEIFESAMTHAETLIRQQLAQNDAQIAKDLIAIFLSLDMQYFVENFEQIKFKCCVAICVAHADTCATYLCNQFHTDNSCYNANIRILMLQILAATAMELSHKNSSNVAQTIPNKNTQILSYKKKFDFRNEQVERLALAQRVIRERLKSKTNRFISKRASSGAEGQENAFHKVVGTFFFKLIRGPRTQQMLRFKANHITQDIDTMLLVNFLHTLSVFVINALNSPLMGVMAREVFDLCAFVRFSEEAKVRLGTLELIGSTLVSTPPYILQTQLTEQLIETQRWLEYFVKSPLMGGEPSEECRDMAAQILNHFYKLQNPNTNEN